MTYVAKANSSSTRVESGLYLTETGTPDMDVNYSAGAVKNGRDYYETPSGAALAVTAASANTS